MINGRLPVIYLQEDGWSWPVWLEGGETRREETVGKGERREGEEREEGVSCFGPDSGVEFPHR